ncbi:MAG: hypothetical protein COA79_10155 [Planctomycetota bacterium]|nr:MAG: hypothetical protein COA79_10155 [Planctomycetota bacterium]
MTEKRRNTGVPLNISNFKRVSPTQRLNLIKCPACEYTRKLKEVAPIDECPQCGIHYTKHKMESEAASIENSKDIPTEIINKTPRAESEGILNSVPKVTVAEQAISSEISKDENDSRMVIADKLDVGNCFDNSWKIYSTNFLMLMVTSFVGTFIMIFSLFILAGPVMGGYASMLLRCIRSKEKKIRFSDMFSQLDKSVPLCLLFFVPLFLVIFGVLILPHFVPSIVLVLIYFGVIISIGILIYQYTFIELIEHDLWPTESIKGGFRILIEGGIGRNILLYLSVLGISSLGYYDYIGWILSFIITPLVSLLYVFAYLQVAPQDDSEYLNFKAHTLVDNPIPN